MDKWPFDEGQIVVCVDVKGLEVKTFSAPLIEGNKYTIKSCFAPVVKTDEIGVYLEEIRGEFLPDVNAERGFRYTRFRPLDEMDNQVSLIFSDIISGNYDKSLDSEENPYKVLETVE